MMRLVAILLAFISLFIFPWPVTALLMLGAGLLLPFSALALGIIADLVYFVPGGAFMPYFTVLGLVFFMISLLVHRFVKTRIITE